MRPHFIRDCEDGRGGGGISNSGSSSRGRDSGGGGSGGVFSNGYKDAFRFRPDRRPPDKRVTGGRQRDDGGDGGKKNDG